MRTNYVMVDFENTQPESLDELPVGAFKIKVFVGAAQVKARVAMKFSMSMQRHGANAQYVEMTRSGPNAMDMHIAYFLGQLLALEPDASVHIVSKDKDFDPLIEFLDKHGGRCTRVKSIAEISRQHAPARAAPAAKPAPRARTPAAPRPVAPKPSAKHVPAAAKPAAPLPVPATRRSAPGDPDASVLSLVKQLRSMNGKPRTRKSLAQTIDSYFKHHGGARGDQAVGQAIEELLRRGFISLNGTKVGYTLGP